MFYEDDNCNIFKNVNIDDMKYIRRNLINCIFATDMAFHFDGLKELNDLISNRKLELQSNQIPIEPEKDRIILLKNILHSADISNPTKIWNSSKVWSDLVMEEFFSQGDRERVAGLQISPGMDRFTSYQDEISLNFIV